MFSATRRGREQSEESEGDGDRCESLPEVSSLVASIVESVLLDGAIGMKSFGC